MRLQPFGSKSASMTSALRAIANGRGAFWPDAEATPVRNIHRLRGAYQEAGRRCRSGALCEAAASLLLRVKTWSALRAWGLRIAKRSSMLCAIVVVARKLASILHRMWVSETDFHVGLGAKVTQRLPLKPAH